eukprot:m.233986 g.233986  ORF g.233986 m.233986 type:complete len:362 (+) comp13911_c1_seq1:32-1117(+)
MSKWQILREAILNAAKDIKEQQQQQDENDSGSDSDDMDDGRGTTTGSGKHNKDSVMRFSNIGLFTSKRCSKTICTEKQLSSSIPHRSFDKMGRIFINEDNVNEQVDELEAEEKQKSKGNNNSSGILGKWHIHQHHRGCEGFSSPVVFHSSPKVTLEAMIGFNNTGNVCIWPSEEALTQFVLSNKEEFDGKRVCEIGGGMASLAGLAVAMACKPECVVLTDGNEVSVSCIDATLRANDAVLNSVDTTTCRLLDWTNESHFASMKESFDVVLCADCCFFDDVRADLINVLSTIVDANGIVYMIAPERSGTRSDFLKQAKEVFHVEEVERYDKEVLELLQTHQMNNDLFDDNIHYPKLAKLTKE